MAVKIRLRRMGKKRQPSYRVIVADGRSPRDGRFIEQIGRYDPLQEPSLVEIDNDRALEWLANGAQPTDAVRKLLQISGAWGRFRATKGETVSLGAAEPPPPKKKTSKKQRAAAAAAAEAAEAGEDVAEEAAAETAADSDEAEPTEEAAPEATEDAPAEEAAEEAAPQEAAEDAPAEEPAQEAAEQPAKEEEE